MGPRSVTTGLGRDCRHGHRHSFRSSSRHGTRSAWSRALSHSPSHAIYHLSETGRKASLLAGGDGRGLQRLSVQVPTTRLHLVAVDVNGVARLKLQPRFELTRGPARRAA